MTSKKWLIQFGIITACVLLLLAFAVYTIDPYFHYRVKDNTYLLKSNFVESGLVKNAEYDTVIIGSSMTQNFNMNEFRKNLSVKPLKVTTGGMKLNEMIYMLSLVNKQSKASNYFICLDQYLFTAELDGLEQRFPEYLADNAILNDYRYFFGFETWFRFIPVDIALSAAKAIHIDLPQKLEYSTSIDYLEDWSLDYDFGEDLVINNYLNNIASVSAVNTDGLLELMKHNYNLLLNEIEFSNGNYTFFFPPYSSLFWSIAEENSYIDIYGDFKEYVIDTLNEYDNVRVFDFQVSDCTMDLNNYKDTTHYSPEINSYMVECFSNDECLLISDNVAKNNEQIKQNIITLKNNYPQLNN